VGAPSVCDVLADLQRDAAEIDDAAREFEPVKPPAVEVELKPTLIRDHVTQWVPHSGPENGDDKHDVVQTEAARGRLDLTAIRALRRRQEPKLPMNVRMPASLRDDVDMIRSLTGTTLTEIVEEAVRREVARLKRAYGLE